MREKEVTFGPNKIVDFDRRSPPSQLLPESDPTLSIGDLPPSGPTPPKQGQTPSGPGRPPRTTRRAKSTRQAPPEASAPSPGAITPEAVVEPVVVSTGPGPVSFNLNPSMILDSAVEGLTKTATSVVGTATSVVGTATSVFGTATSAAVKAMTSTTAEPPPPVKTSGTASEKNPKTVPQQTGPSNGGTHNNSPRGFLTAALTGALTGASKAVANATNTLSGLFANFRSSPPETPHCQPPTREAPTPQAPTTQASTPEAQHHITSRARSALRNGVISLCQSIRGKKELTGEQKIKYSNEISNSLTYDNKYIDNSVEAKLIVVAGIIDRQITEINEKKYFGAKDPKDVYYELLLETHNNMITTRDGLKSEYLKMIKDWRDNGSNKYIKAELVDKRDPDMPRVWTTKPPREEKPSRSPRQPLKANELPQRGQSRGPRS